MADVELMTKERLAEIADLVEEFGNSFDPRLGRGFGALRDLLQERDAMREAFLPSSDSPPPAGCPLSAVEVAALICAANGFTALGHAETANESNRTINSRRASAIRTLRAANCTQAVAICMANGWITADDVPTPRRYS